VSARGVRGAAVIAASLCVLSTIAFGLWLPGYSQLAHPVALLGARGIAHATAFNVCAFMLPGLAAAWVCWRLRSGMPAQAGFAARIGAGLTVLAALAFALQGVLPLDPEDLEATFSRAHAAAWTAWWIAFAAGACALAFGRDGRPRSRAWAAGCVLAAVVVASSATVAWPWTSSAVTQRVAFAAWFAWLCCAARRA